MRIAPMWKRTGCTKDSLAERRGQRRTENTRAWRRGDCLRKRPYLDSAAAGWAGVGWGCGARAGTAAPAGMGRGLTTRGIIRLSPKVPEFEVCFSTSIVFPAIELHPILSLHHTIRYPKILSGVLFGAIKQNMPLRQPIGKVVFSASSCNFLS